MLKYQLFEHCGSRLYITGQKEARNAAQIAFSQRETDIAKRIVLEKAGEACVPVSDEELLILWNRVYGSLGRYSPRLFELLKMEELNARFMGASRDGKTEGVLAICAVAGAGANIADLSGLHGSRQAGKIQPTYNKLLAGGVDLIDQSITGMFERRTRIGL